MRCSSLPKVFEDSVTRATQINAVLGEKWISLDIQTVQTEQKITQLYFCQGRELDLGIIAILHVPLNLRLWVMVVLVWWKRVTTVR